jgi:DNA-binding MltR family transcriptional regulator
MIFTEHRIFKKKSERDKVYGLSNNRDELRKNLIARMESLTHASEDVCVSILERNSYDLETSVEAYLSDSRQHNNY